MNRRAVVVLLLVASFGAGVHARNMVSKTGLFNVSVRSSPASIPLNELFELEVEVRRTDAHAQQGEIKLSVLATMPAHRHGMTTVPKVTSLGDGRFRVEGLLFHMSGEWRCDFEISDGTRNDRASTTFLIE